MLYGILTTLLVIVSVALVGVILLQRSEGGALGMGGGPSGFMTARGAGNLLTRTTAILTGLFFTLSVALTIVGNLDRRASSLDASKVKSLDLNALRPAQRPASAPPSSPQQVPAQPSLDDLTAPVAPAEPKTSLAAPAQRSGPDPLVTLAPTPTTPELPQTKAPKPDATRP